MTKPKAEPRETKGGPAQSQAQLQAKSKSKAQQAQQAAPKQVGLPQPPPILSAYKDSGFANKIINSVKPSTKAQPFFLDPLHGFQSTVSVEFKPGGMLPVHNLKGRSKSPQEDGLGRSSPKTRYSRGSLFDTPDEEGNPKAKNRRRFSKSENLQSGQTSIANSLDKTAPIHILSRPNTSTSSSKELMGKDGQNRKGSVHGDKGNITGMDGLQSPNKDLKRRKSSAVSAISGINQNTTGDTKNGQNNNISATAGNDNNVLGQDGKDISPEGKLVLDPNAVANSILIDNKNSQSQQGSAQNSKGDGALKKTEPNKDRDGQKDKDRLLTQTAQVSENSNGEGSTAGRKDNKETKDNAEINSMHEGSTDNPKSMKTSLPKLDASFLDGGDLKSPSRRTSTVSKLSNYKQDLKDQGEIDHLSCFGSFSRRSSFQNIDRDDISRTSQLGRKYSTAGRGSGSENEKCVLTMRPISRRGSVLKSVNDTDTDDLERQRFYKNTFGTPQSDFIALDKAQLPFKKALELKAYRVLIILLILILALLLFMGYISEPQTAIVIQNTTQCICEEAVAHTELPMPVPAQPLNAKVLLNCKDLRNYGFNETGVYQVQPRSSPTFLVWCEMDLANTRQPINGYTVIQRRNNGDLSFERSYKEYQRGFGRVSGDHFLGTQYIYFLTHDVDRCRLRIELITDEGIFWLEYDVIILGKNELSAELYLEYYNDKYSNLENVIGEFDYVNLTTYDADNDSDENKNCAIMHSAGFWWHQCGGANLNGIWGAERPKGVYYGNRTFHIYSVRMMIIHNS